MIPDLYTVICYSAMSPTDIETIKNFQSFPSAYHFAIDYGSTFIFDRIEVYYRDERVLEVSTNNCGESEIRDYRKKFF